MYKKFILIAVVFSPFLFSMFIGYPVVSSDIYQSRARDVSNAAISKRCFSVGDWREFKTCWKISNRLSGLTLTTEVFEKTNKISSLFTATALLAFFLFLVFSVLILLIESKDGKK